MSSKADVTILRDLAKRCRDAAESQDRERTKQLWRRLHDCDMERPMIYIWVILFTDELKEITDLKCADPLFREKEKELRIELYHHYTGDDYLIEPFITLRASYAGLERGSWGVPFQRRLFKGRRPVDGGAADVYADPPLKSLDDLSMIRPVEHCIDEEATAERRGRLEDAVDDIMPFHVSRAPVYFREFFAPAVTNMRGMGPLMMDMCENPAGQHRLLRKMQKAVIAEGRDILEKNGCHYEIDLEDVLTAQGDRERLREWVEIVRSVIE